jgi:hypothetical protein
MKASNLEALDRVRLVHIGCGQRLSSVPRLITNPLGTAPRYHTTVKDLPFLLTTLSDILGDTDG